MSKLKIKARGISMEVVGKDDLIQREREAFLEYAENHKGIQIGVTAIPVIKTVPGTHELQVQLRQRGTGNRNRGQAGGQH